MAHTHSQYIFEQSKYNYAVSFTWVLKDSSVSAPFALLAVSLACHFGSEITQTYWNDRLVNTTIHYACLLHSIYIIAGRLCRSSVCKWIGKVGI